MLTRIAASAALTPPATIGAPGPPRPPAPDRRDTSVLVIDDHADSRIVVRIVLEQAGFSVVDAQTGVDGLQAALDLQPRVVLLDMVLPGLDGWEIARRLRRDERTAR